MTYGLSFQMDVRWLIPFAAGNFLYIGASDLVPEVNKHTNIQANVVHFVAFVFGLALLRRETNSILIEQSPLTMEKRCSMKPTMCDDLTTRALVVRRSVLSKPHGRG